MSPQVRERFRPGKVVHLTSVHSPRDTRILLRECAALAQASYDVVLVAPHPRDERLEGIIVRAVPCPRNRPERLTRTVWHVLRAALRERAELYHLHDPELLPLAPVLRRHGAKVVYDVHEDVALQVLNKHWIPGALRGSVSTAVTWVEHATRRWIDAFVAATPAIAANYPPARTVVVQNFPIIEELRIAEPVPLDRRESVAVYVGVLADIRGVREMVAAVGRVPREFGLSLVLAGRWSPPDLAGEVSKVRGWERVSVLPWQDRAGVRDLLGRAKMGLVLLHPAPNYLDSYPVKLFEYMSAGIPVVASDIPLWRRIIEDARCGIVVSPSDTGAIAAAMTRLLEEPELAAAMGASGRRAVETRFNWEPERAKLLALYERLLA